MSHIQRHSDPGPTMDRTMRATELGPTLQSLGRRLRLRDGVWTASRTLWLALTTATLILMAGRLTPIEHLGGWTAAPVVIWASAVVVSTLLHPLTTATIARRADRLLQLEERLSTAVTLRLQGARGELVDRQWADAVFAARRIDPHRDLRLPVHRRGIQSAIVAALAVAALLIAPNPMDLVLERRATVRQAAQEEAKQIDELRAAVEQQTAPTAEKRAETLYALADLARDLRANPGSPEQGLADIAQTEDRLRALRDPEIAPRQASLEQLAEQLAHLAAPESGRAAGSQTPLQDLAPALAAMSPAQQEAAARQLDQLATTLDAVAPGLAQAVAELARATRHGSSPEVQHAAEVVASAVVQAQREQALQQALDQALAQLQRSREAIARAGRAGVSAGARADASAGDGRAGQGAANGQGQAGGGGGTTARQLPPSARTGRADDPTGPAREPAVGELDEIYAPRIDGGSGEVDSVAGVPDAQGEVETRQERQSLPAGGTAHVPYTDVLPTYREAATAAMEREYVPPGLRDYVKAYFSRLDPASEDAAASEEP
jgi:hypothetical protein